MQLKAISQLPSSPQTKVRWNLPFLSSLLLLVAYLIFGHFLLSLFPGWLAAVVAIAWVVMLTTLFVFPAFKPERLIYHLLQSDTIAFLMLVVASALISVIALWFNVALLLLLVISAEALVSLDVRRANFSDFASCCFLVLPAGAGLGLAWLIQFS